MKNRITISTVLPVTAEVLYIGWLTGRIHTAFTGAKATASKKTGGKFTAWDGYITGKNVELESNVRIVQTWRSSEFSPEDADSLLEVCFSAAKKGTKITIIHSNIPNGQAERYKQGWSDFYFTPMKNYYNKMADEKKEK